MSLNFKLPMNHPQHIAKHLQDVHFGGNWTWSNLNDVLADVDWQQATKQLHDLNTIAKLTFHIHYFVAAVLSVLEGNPLEAHDKYSFDVPPINSQEDWDKLRTKALKDAKKAAALIEQLPENKLWDTFVLEKYG
ncbi:MAG TPA: DUF1572 domain-containing protein, partial [Flavobacteriales bacterium]|nr:DUF1572 domain-containing protein [Flavobacteriales bacterium]